MHRIDKVAPHRILSLVAACALLAAGCSDDSSPSPDSAVPDGAVPDGAVADGPGGCVVVVTDDVDQPTTWNTGCVYLIEAWNMYVNDTLTIEEGVIVKFHETKGPEMLLGGSGTIVAKGTTSSPIVFTSWKDDSQGGDTNQDGNVTAPAPGDWDGVMTNALNGSIFEHCEFYYGGGGSYNATLDLAGSVATVKDCLFVNNRGGKSGCCYYGALQGSGALEGTVITGNTFYNNILPLSIDLTYSLDASNTFHNPADTSQINQYNGVFLEASGEFNKAIKWDETEVPYVVNDNDLWINSGASLTLADDVAIKFTTDSTLLHDGTNFLNHDGTGVELTSYKDDTVKGDTNGDGSATSPADQDWNGIYNDGTGNYETWSNIHYDSY